MFLAIIIFIVALIFVFMATIKHKEKQEILRQEKIIKKKFEDVSQAYFHRVSVLSDQVLISPENALKLKEIVKNYFVFQQVNKDTLTYFEEIIGYLYDTLEDKISYGQLDMERFKNGLEMFCYNLPTNVRGYRADFYLSKLRPKIQDLAATKIKISENEDSDEITSVDLDDSSIDIDDNANAKKQPKHQEEILESAD